MFIRNCLTPREEIVTVTPDISLQETLEILQKNGLDSVPVVDEDGFTFLGIVKISDIEAVLTTTYGQGIPGVRFLLGVLVDAPHELEQIMECVKSFDVNI